MYICVDLWHIKEEIRLDLLCYEIKSKSELKSIIVVKNEGTVLEWNDSGDLAD